MVAGGVLVAGKSVLSVVVGHGKNQQTLGLADLEEDGTIVHEGQRYGRPSSFVTEMLRREGVRSGGQLEDNASVNSKRAVRPFSAIRYGGRSLETIRRSSKRASPVNTTSCEGEVAVRKDDAEEDRDVPELTTASHTRVERNAIMQPGLRGVQHCEQGLTAKGQQSHRKRLAEPKANLVGTGDNEQSRASGKKAKPESAKKSGVASAPSQGLTATRPSSSPAKQGAHREAASASRSHAAARTSPKKGADLAYACSNAALGCSFYAGSDGYCSKCAAERAELASTHAAPVGVSSSAVAAQRECEGGQRDSHQPETTASKLPPGWTEVSQQLYLAHHPCIRMLHAACSFSRVPCDGARARAALLERAHHSHVDAGAV